MRSQLNPSVRAATVTGGHGNPVHIAVLKIPPFPAEMKKEHWMKSGTLLQTFARDKNQIGDVLEDIEKKYHFRPYEPSSHGGDSKDNFDKFVGSYNKYVVGLKDLLKLVVYHHDAAQKLKDVTPGYLRHIEELQRCVMKFGADLAAYAKWAVDAHNMIHPDNKAVVQVSDHSIAWHH